MSLVNESINDAALVSQYKANLGGATINNDGTTYDVLMPNFRVTHYYGTSGAIIYYSQANNNPMTFSETAAQQFATSFVQQNMNLPSDAVLTSVLQFWEVLPSGSAVNVAYEFIWHHAGSLQGADAIKLIVDDAQTSHLTCTKPSPCGCQAWTTRYTDNLYVDFAGSSPNFLLHG